MSSVRNRRCPHCQHEYAPGRGGYTIDAEHTIRCSACGKAILAGTEAAEEEASAPYKRPAKPVDQRGHHHHHSHHHSHHRGHVGGVGVHGNVHGTTGSIPGQTGWSGEDYD